MEPDWPEYVLRFSKVAGVVLLDVWIDQNGRVTCVQVKRSIPIVDPAVVAAVSQWRFSPAKADGQSIGVVQEVSIRFPPQVSK